MSTGVTTEQVSVLSFSELPPGESTTVKAFGTTVALFNIEGELFAVGNNCPHQGGPLCYGRISGVHLPSQPHEYRYGREDRVLVCPWHGWEFDIESGQTMFDPSVRVKTYEVQVQNGEVVLTRWRRKES